MSSMLLGPIADPHCGRSSQDRIGLRVGGDEWTVEWGRYDAFGSPAYWVDQTVRGRYQERVAEAAQCSDLLSETVFCLLGGYGVTAEAAAAAHVAVMPTIERDVLPTAAELEAILRHPMADGRRYRFPRQRAERIAAAVASLRTATVPAKAVAMRDYLLTLTGVGPKTAAWIVRNVTGSADVAIVDIWLVRALTPAGVFPAGWRVDRHYERFESAFLQFAAHGLVLPGGLDLCVWEQARTIGHEFFAAA